MNKVIRQKDHVVGVILGKNYEQLGVYCYLGNYDEIRCYSMSTFVSMLMNDAVLHGDKGFSSRFFNVPDYQYDKDGVFGNRDINGVINKMLYSTTDDWNVVNEDRGLFSSKLFFSYRDVFSLDLGIEASKYNPDGFSVNTYTPNGKLHSASKLITIVGCTFEDSRTVQSYKIVTENLDILIVTKQDLLNYLSNGYFIANDKNAISKGNFSEYTWFDFFGEAPVIKEKQLSEDYHNITVEDLFADGLKALNNILIEFVWFDKNIVYYDVFNRMMLLSNSKIALTLKNTSNNVIIKHLENPFLNEEVVENLTISSSLYQTMKYLTSSNESLSYVCYRYQNEPVAMVRLNYMDNKKEATYSDVKTKLGLNVFMFNKYDLNKRCSEAFVKKLNSRNCYISSVANATEEMRFKVKSLLNDAKTVNDYPFVVVDL